MRGEPIHLWEVGASKPDKRADGSINRRPDYTNLRFAVVARTMERVMQLAVEQYGPDIAFHTIQKRNYMGEAKVLVDPEVAEIVIREDDQ
jgi:hypothetical protein